MRSLPWLEVALIVALAVALIVKAKPNEIRAQPPEGQSSMNTSAGSFVGLGLR